MMPVGCVPADMQERILAETGTQHESGWRKNYFMPAQADRYVAHPVPHLQKLSASSLQRKCLNVCS